MGVAYRRQGVQLGAILPRVTRLVSSVEVCDVCENPRRKVKMYRVGNSDYLARLWLCREHGSQLDPLIELGVRVAQAPHRAKKWTMEEIDAERTKQGKAKRPPA
jgi:hypothetical protein